MDQRAAYLIQIFEHIGSPLMTSIISGANARAADAQSTAQNMAALLAKTVKLSIDIGETTDINKSGGDSVRVALAGIAGPMIADLYQRDAQIPEDADIEKVASAFEAVLAFSDNFIPDDEIIKRTALLKHYDSTQMHLNYIQAFVPVIDAIAGFPFGQPEKKLTTDVSARLTHKASQIARAILGEGDHALSELAILNALAQLYAACHVAETKRLSDSQNSDQPISIDTVWDAFDMRADMVEILATQLLDGKSSAPAQAAPQPATNEAAPSAETKAETEAAPETQAPPPPPPASAPTPAPEEEQTQPPPADKPAGGNPMAMFAKKPQTESPPPEEPSSAAPPTSPPPAPSADEQPPTPPATDSTADQDDDDSSSGDGGNPMSFFKK